MQENATATLIHCDIQACGSDAVLTHGEGTTLTMIGCAVHHNQGHGIHADDLSEIVVSEEYLNSVITQSTVLLRPELDDDDAWEYTVVRGSVAAAEN